MLTIDLVLADIDIFEDEAANQATAPARLSQFALGGSGISHGVQLNGAPLAVHSDTSLQYKISTLRRTI
jgi:hypothetical protein